MRGLNTARKVRIMRIGDGELDELGVGVGLGREDLG